MGLRRALVAIVAAGLSFTATPGISQRSSLPAPKGPCTADAAHGMPEGKEHDHFDLSQHELSCRIQLLKFLPLKDELSALPNVVLGEMDVKADIAVVGTAYPESGFLVFDVSDPSSPEFKSWYRGSQCEGAVFDIDCGAFVDLSSDGKTVFMSVQDLTVIPGDVPGVGTRPVSEPGVEVVDISDPLQPILTQIYPVVSLGGVHTSRSHEIKEGASSGPRVPGEYLFSVANGFGIEITRIERVADKALLTPLFRLDLPEVHDMFIQNDPLADRTYMYVAGGFTTGFWVYDVTDPGAPELLGEWDATPECTSDWYAHTVYPAIRNGHRYVMLDVEIFDFGLQDEPGCGGFSGNFDKPGPLWIVDATDLSKLGRPGDSPEDLKKRSKRQLVATWTNPAGRAGGNLTFSPHNQQVVGNRIYLSSYHGGIYVLDASAAFDGRSVRPSELGYYVPHSGARPVYEAPVPPNSPFFSTFLTGTPLVWDMYFYRGYILAADMVGGFYSLRYAGDRH